MRPPNNIANETYQKKCWKEKMRLSCVSSGLPCLLLQHALAGNGAGKEHTDVLFDRRGSSLHMLCYDKKIGILRLLLSF